jgi:hypothetical protein
VWNEQHSVFTAACIRGVADNLAGIVDSNGVRKSEAAIGRNQLVEIDQPAGTVNERNMLAGFGRVVRRATSAIPFKSQFKCNRKN